MKYSILVVLIFFTSSGAQNNTKFINVNGTSELVRTADQVNFRIQIRTTAESIEESKKDNDESLEDLLNILNKTGINPDDIQVSPIKLGKNFEFDETTQKQKQKGYYTDIEVSFLLKDLSKYFELTNQIAESNSFVIINSYYTISDYETQHKNAYIDALNAARQKAEYMTYALEVSLGEILEIDELNQLQTYPNPTNSITYENAQGGNISGKVTIKRSVRVKFILN